MLNKNILIYLFLFASFVSNIFGTFAYTSGSSDNIVISTSNDESGYEGANALTSGFTSTPSDNWSSFKRGMYDWYGVASSSSTTLTDGTSINGEYIQISNSDSTVVNLEQLLVFEPLSVPYHGASNYYARTALLVGSNDSSALSAGSSDSVWELLSSTSTVLGDGSTLTITGAPDTYVKIENTTGIGYKYYRYVISETGNNPYRTGASGIAFTEFVDSDGDGVGDYADAFPSDPSETVDTDSDGVGNNADADDDGDGLSDLDEATNGTNPLLADTDGDGVGDNADVFPSDATETADTDGDSVGDNADAFPSDPSESADTDGDSVGDNADAFPSDPSESADTDGDSVGDNADAFPSDPSETADTDGDSVGDNADAFPSDPSESADTDGDSVGDNADVHPGYNDAELTTYLSNNNYAKTSEIIDARAGSTLITVSNGVATVELEMEQSDDLQTWSEIDGSTSMDIPADASVKFFRFKMAD